METRMKPQKRSTKLLRKCGDAWRRLRSSLKPTAASTRRAMSGERVSISDMRGPKLIVQPDDGEKPVVDFLHSAQKTVALKQFTFTHPLPLDAVMALHKKGVRVRVMLNGAKATGERLNDPFFDKMKSAGVEVQWSNPSFLVTHEKSIIVDGKSALLATFNFMEKILPGHPRLRGLDQRSGPGRAGPGVLRLRLEPRTISSARRCRARVEPGICPSSR